MPYDYAKHKTDEMSREVLQSVSMRYRLFKKHPTSVFDFAEMIASANIFLTKKLFERYLRDELSVSPRLARQALTINDKLQDFKDRLDRFNLSFPILLHLAELDNAEIILVIEELEISGALTAQETMAKILQGAPSNDEPTHGFYTGGKVGLSSLAMLNASADIRAFQLKVQDVVEDIEALMSDKRSTGTPRTIPTTLRDKAQAADGQLLKIGPFSPASSENNADIRDLVLPPQSPWFAIHEVLKALSSNKPPAVGDQLSTWLSSAISRLEWAISDLNDPQSGGYGAKLENQIWGRWYDLPAAAKPLLYFAEKMSKFTAPEDRAKEYGKTLREARMSFDSDEEADVFFEMIMKARELLGAQDDNVSGKDGGKG